MHYRDPRVDATQIKQWVVVESGTIVHYFETFDEAINGPKGHVMSRHYYEYSYKPDHETK